MRRSSLGLGFALTLLTLARLAAGDTALPDTERRSIEALIASVQQLEGASFVRNGEEYSPPDAARFLRKKWDSRKDEVRTAHEFIDKVGSFSSTTGKPYLIRHADGREQPSEEFLKARLAAQPLPTPERPR